MWRHEKLSELFAYTNFCQYEGLYPYKSVPHDSIPITYNMPPPKDPVLDKTLLIAPILTQMKPSNMYVAL